MRLRIIATIGLISGMLALGVALTPAANGAPAPAPLLEPSPRPTLVPTAAPRPTARPSHKTAATQYGRITGTVIDQTTSAPTAGMVVLIGDHTVLTDANGNYDTWVPVGSYRVSLTLSQAQGTSAQADKTVAIATSATTVQHLYFTSPAPVAAPTTAPTAMPSAAPTALPAVGVLPDVAGGTVPSKPEKLPVTAGDDLPLALWLWLALFLVVGGGVLNSRAVRNALVGRALATNTPTNVDNFTLLLTLLTAAPRPVPIAKPASSKQDAALLEALLNRE